jgi:hypothetical protein
MCVVARTEAQALLVTNFVVDTVEPTTVSAGFVLFDLQNGRLTLSFSEPINRLSVQPEYITLTQLFADADSSYTLTGGSVIDTQDSTRFTHCR